jgi:hypothetical protein
MLTKEQIVGNMYGIRSVTDGMIGLVTADGIEPSKALDAIALVVTLAMRETAQDSEML